MSRVATRSVTRSTATQNPARPSAQSARTGTSGARFPQTPTPPGGDHTSGLYDRGNASQPPGNPSGNQQPPGGQPPQDDPQDPDPDGNDDPDDPEDPDDPDDPNQPPPPGPLPVPPPQSDPVADAMRLLAQAIAGNKEPGKSKVREPDVFDGTSPKKLRTFLVQCQLNFDDRPTVFATERSKVTFALSYLSGTALSWFEPELVKRSLFPPPWMVSYNHFKDELQKHFGPFDPEGEAEIAIENLFMKDNQRITKYIVEFYRLSSEINWDDASLRRRFYKNLPARIKNEISRVGKPNTLNGMRDLAQAIDQRYWEREEEIRQEKKFASSNSGNNNGNSGNTSSNSGKPYDKKKSSNRPSGNNNSGSNNSASSSSSSNNRSGGSNSSNNTPKTPDYASKLGKDGKLTPEERQRRMNNKLCLFCGQPGHNAANCPKSSSNASKAKARGSNLVSSSESSDSKK